MFLNVYWSQLIIIPPTTHTQTYIYIYICSVGFYKLLSKSKKYLKVLDISRTIWSILSTQKYYASYLLTYLVTYLLTPWNRVLLEKVTGFQLVKKFRAFYGTRKFNTTFTSARHLSLSVLVQVQDFLYECFVTI